MHPVPTVRPWRQAFVAAVLVMPGLASGQADPVDGMNGLFKQKGTDPTFKSLMDGGFIPVGKNSTSGIEGSLIDVNNRRVEDKGGAMAGIPTDIRIHTLCNSAIKRGDFPKWTRWYQEDGKTQVFRLFKGEHNVRNARENAARIEAFGGGWERGEWREWQGTYTIIKPHGSAIFQSMNSENEWSCHINMTDDGDILLSHRRNQKDKIIARNMTGKSFQIRVRDNGHDYAVFLDGREVGTGTYDRPAGTNAFRWGMYVGNHEVRHDAMIFVSGATFR